MNQNRMTREAILSEIRRTAQENGGVALGKKRFLDATGIAESDWCGRYWTRWSDAVAEAGFVVQSMNPRPPDVDVIEAAAAIVRSLGHFPTAAEIRLAASSNLRNGVRMWRCRVDHPQRFGDKPHAQVQVGIALCLTEDQRLQLLEHRERALKE